MTQITKLYTEEQLFDICQSVAEKMCANSLPKESVIDKCKYYGHSKIQIDIETIKESMNDDNIDVINVVRSSMTPREIAMFRWNDLHPLDRVDLGRKYFPDRHYSSLTGREIEEIMK